MADTFLASGGGVEGTQCPLLELPIELRDMIWSLALVHTDTITVKQIVYAPTDLSFTSLRTCDLHDNPCNIGLAPSLLATCSQIKHEGTPILYGQNRIEFSISRGGGFSTFALFLQTVNESAMHLRDIKLDGEELKKSCQANFVALKRLGVKLSKLSLGTAHRYQYSPEQMALALRPLLRTLDKQGKDDTTRKLTYVLDKLMFPPGFYPSYPDDSPESKYYRQQSQMRANNAAESMMRM